jgi:hypothetical protein
MRSLFEKEEKETALNQLKVDLISRFYPRSSTCSAGHVEAR